MPPIPLSSGVTFSDVVSATEPCKPCTECMGLQSMSAPCVEADDAMCRCAYGYYQDETTGRCEACRVCEADSGLVFSCQDKQNTVCEECPDGTYSDEANHVDPCLPCTRSLDVGLHGPHPQRAQTAQTPAPRSPRYLQSKIW